MLRRVVVWSLALSLASTPALAQDSVARPVTPGAMKAAEELLGLMNAEALLRAGIAITLEGQIKSNPKMEPFRATMQEWVDTYITWAELRGKMSRIYAEEFTEAELRELIAFYASPVGRKVAELSPALSRRGAEAGAEVAQAHMDELRRMIEARAAELQQSGELTP